jgi:hypothetical protein
VVFSIKTWEKLVEENPETITDGPMCHSKKSVPVMLQEVARMLDLLHKLGSGQTFKRATTISKKR